MARRPSRKRHHSFLGDDINLIPVMNIFMVLIPFLLLTTVFAKTALIDIYLPSESPSGKKAAEANPAEVLTIHMTDSGFAFSGLGHGMPAIIKKDGAFDFELLARKVEEIKAQHSDREEVIILFEPDIHYELVIKAMDAVREIVEIKDGKAARKTLFPLVSVGEHVREGK